MAYMQNSTISNAKLILGNCKFETAATSGGTYVNVGNGKVTAAGHNITMYDVQGQNGPDPLEGIADESFTIAFELYEFDGSVLSAIQCGAISESNTSVLSTIVGGGNTQLTQRAFKITNTTMTAAGNTAETIMTVFTATMDNGLQFSFKGDQEADPIAVISGTIVAKNDGSKTAGQQLFEITRTKTT